MIKRKVKEGRISSETDWKREGNQSERERERGKNEPPNACILDAIDCGTEAEPSGRE